MLITSETEFISGHAGKIETLYEQYKSPIGIALVAHPHPLGGGNNSNKIVYSLARTFLHMGYLAVRPNFRGVGKTEGIHDDGKGEVDDLLTVLQYTKNKYGDLPVVLAGFSFGAYCQTHLYQRLKQLEQEVKVMVLVGTAAGNVDRRDYDTASVPSNSLIIHGDKDEIVPLPNVLQWAGELDLPVVVVPGADHFFHRRLHFIRQLVEQYWHGYRL